MQGYFKVPAPLLELSDEDIDTFAVANVILVSPSRQPAQCPNTRAHGNIILVAFFGDPQSMSLPAGWTTAFLVNKVESEPIYDGEEITGYTPDYEVIVEIPPGFINFMVDSDDVGGRPLTLKEFHRFMGFPERF